MKTRPHVVSPSERSALRDLELLARTTVEGLRQGLHRSPFHGYSAEFSQYRHYRPGDDLKYVDWKLFGRTDRLYSRQFRETTNLGALFVLDASRSMDFPATAPRKFDLARAAAAVLATLVIDQGDAAGLLAVNGGQRAGAAYVPTRSGSHHLHVLLAELARLTCDGDEGIAAGLRRAGTLLRRRSLVIALSDFYDDGAALAEVRRLARSGHDVVVVQVMAADELRLPRVGAAEFVDLESGATLVANAETVAADYARQVEAFLARVKRGVESEGLSYLRLVTGDNLEMALRSFLLARRSGAPA